MKNYIKEIIILIIQLFIFYVYPLFVGEAMEMVFFIWISTIILGLLIRLISANKIKYLYPIVISILFIPSIFIYYNSSALIHSVWYLVSSGIGMLIGSIIHLFIKK